MIVFKDTNIWLSERRKTIKQNFVEVFASNKRLIPFQIHSDYIVNVKKIYLSNGVTQEDVTAKFLTISYKTALNINGSWHICQALNNVDFDCGNYQLIVVLTDLATDFTYYSNFFNVATFNDFLLIGNDNDFLGKLYGSKFSERLYLPTYRLKRTEPFIYEDSEDNGDGTNTVTYQNLLEQFIVKFFLTSRYYNELSKIVLYNNIKFVYEKTIYDVIDTPIIESDYNSELQLFEVEITFKVNSIEKTACQSDFNVFTFTGLQEDNRINDSNDRLKINNTDNLIIN